MISNTLNDKQVINLKLGDFGFARQFEQDIQLTWTRLGTALYTAPEIDGVEDRDPEGYDYKADIWSIGCIVYEICTTKYAFWDGRTRYDAMQIRNNIQTQEIPTLDQKHSLARVLPK